MKKKEWQNYEEKVFEYLRSKHPNANLKQNTKLTGYLSEQQREIDILIEHQLFGVSIQIAVECKDRSRKLNVADVGSFIDRLKDVGISKGVMISKKGYTKAAHTRARKEINIQLQVLEFDHLSEYHGFWALPYRGNLGAIISAPNGWVLNNNISFDLQQHCLCLLHPQEFTIEEAYQARHLMYFQLRSTIVDNTNYSDLENTLKSQDDNIKRDDKKAEITYWKETIKSQVITFRKIYYFNQDYYEYTAGLDFGDFFAYCVCYLPNPYLPDDEARLKFVIENLYLFKHPLIDPLNSDDFWNSFANDPSIIFGEN